MNKNEQVVQDNHPWVNGEHKENDLHKDIKRLASSMEKLVKLLTKVIKENS
jgi:hypothetical protein